MHKTIWLIAAALACSPRAQAQTPPAPPGGNPGRGLMVMAPGCSYQLHAQRIRVGENLPASMSLRNTGQWCGGSFGFSGVSPNGARVVGQPRHGELRMKVVDNGVMFIYRPAAGYQGDDGFRITMPSGSGYDLNLATSVSVER